MQKSMYCKIGSKKTLLFFLKTDVHIKTNFTFALPFIDRKKELVRWVSG